MATSTRIADLPEYNGFSGPGNNVGNNTYLPLDTHPNPYGISPPSQMPLPVASKPGRSGAPPQSQNTDYNPYVDTQQPQHRLPSRDIPMDTTVHTQDEYVQANHIPAPPKRVTFDDKDYVQEYESRVVNKQVTRGPSRLEQLWTEYQTVILVVLLYFTFQLPTVNTVLYKKISFLPLYKEDGSLNLYGLIVKSIIFGLTFYGTMSFVDYLSSGV
jgi:hypothetical protein